jgi:hypothetical protein
MFGSISNFTPDQRRLALKVGGDSAGTKCLRGQKIWDLVHPEPGPAPSPSQRRQQCSVPVASTLQRRCPMANQDNDPIDPNEIPGRTHLATEEQQLLWQLRQRAPKSWARLTTLPMVFMVV